MNMTLTLRSRLFYLGISWWGISLSALNLTTTGVRDVFWFSLVQRDSGNLLWKILSMERMLTRFGRNLTSGRAVCLRFCRFYTYSETSKLIRRTSLIFNITLWYNVVFCLVLLSSQSFSHRKYDELDCSYSIARHSHVRNHRYMPRQCFICRWHWSLIRTGKVCQ